MTKSWNKIFNFGTIAMVLFGILIFASPFFERGSDFYFLDFPNAPGNDQDLILTQNLSSAIEFPDLSLVERTSLKGLSPPNLFRSEVLGTIVGEEEKRDITEYIVKEGDNLWSIAKNFGISKETIISVNNLEDSLLKSGQKLIILPVDGVLHLVKEGDTLGDLAKKYNVEPEKIIAFNQLSEDGDLFLDELLILPGGKMPAKIKPVSQRKIAETPGRQSNYPWGYCTWWVEHKRPIPGSWGNAKNWLDRALASGFDVCLGSNCPARVGAIISLKTFFHPLGHVAYVEEVKGDTVIFSEMNYYQFGQINYRRLKIGDPRIKGYIY
jgi:surface antigen